MRSTLAALLAILLVGNFSNGNGTGIATSILVSTSDAAEPVKLRIATFNMEDVRRTDLGGEDPRLQAAAELVADLNPDLILLAEVAYETGDGGNNGELFVKNYLLPHHAKSKYQVVMLPSNTGVFSGYDLNRDGVIAPEWSTKVRGDSATAKVDEQLKQGLTYGGDCWGFGVFPGQYAMALLVRDGLKLQREEIRTFQKFRWSEMPGALRPKNPKSGESWYTDAVWQQMPLSSKSHWDVPVTLANGTKLHVLCSHPTPPAFDGEEDRNGCRNHDEIRLWSDYLNNADYLVDDQGRRGGLNKDTAFVILGDLNADPLKGDSVDHAIDKLLLSHPRVSGSFTPKVKENPEYIAKRFADLSPADTAQWGMRVDYVLPSKEIKILDGGIVRYISKEKTVSDHFPVWLDVSVR